MKSINLQSFLPLNEEECSLLKTICQTRLRLFRSVFVILFIAGIVYGIRIDSRHSSFGHDRSDRLVSRTQMKCIGVLWLELIIVGSGAYIFLKRIHPLKKDIRDGNKYCILHTVVNKQYFPLTNQYFVSLDDADYMHHEVTGDMFDKVTIGDAFPVYFSRYARYAFNKNGSFTLM